MDRVLFLCSIPMRLGSPAVPSFLSTRLVRPPTGYRQGRYLVLTSSLLTTGSEYRQEPAAHSLTLSYSGFPSALRVCF